MHELILWVQNVAVPKLGLFGMYLVATLDASFVSLPELSDLLVVTGAARTPELAWRFVLVSALGSMTGCLLLYEVGRRGGEALATRFVSREGLLKAESLLTRYGAFAIAIPAMSPPPMPFKGFVLAAGIFAMPRARFAATVFFARSVRFLVWAVLGALYGDRAIGWVEHMDEWARGHPVVVVALLVAMGTAIVFWWRSHQPAEVETDEPRSA